jgi:hypothetical protein
LVEDGEDDIHQRACECEQYERTQTYHLCSVCGLSKPCAELRVTGGAGSLTCQECWKVPPEQEPGIKTFRGVFISDRLKDEDSGDDRTGRDDAYQDMVWYTQAFADMKKRFCDEKGNWRDIYLDVSRRMEPRRYENLEHRYPTNIGWDDVFQYYPINGVTFLYTIDNIGPTAFWLNLAKGTSAPLMMWLIYRYTKATDPGERAEMLRRMNDLHLTQISTCNYTRRSRIGKHLSKVIWTEVLLALKTGCAPDPKVIRELVDNELVKDLREGTAPGVWGNEARTTSGRGPILGWDGASITRLKKIITQMEDKYGNEERVPVHGIDDAPFPFQDSRVDKKWSWQILAGFLALRLRRMKQECNRYFDTEPSIDHLLILLVRAYLDPSWHRLNIFGSPSNLLSEGMSSCQYKSFQDRK